MSSINIYLKVGRLCGAGLPSNNDGVYSLFRVVKPFPVMSSQIAPFGGIQYQTPLPLQTLLRKGIIIKTK